MLAIVLPTPSWLSTLRDWVNRPLKSHTHWLYALLAEATICLLLGISNGVLWWNFDRLDRVGILIAAFSTFALLLMLIVTIPRTVRAHRIDLAYQRHLDFVRQLDEQRSEKRSS